MHLDTFISHTCSVGAENGDEGLEGDSSPELTSVPSLSQDIIEGGSLRIPLQELHQMILTPIKAYSSPSTTPEARRHEPSLMGPENPSTDGKDGAAGANSVTASASAGASGGLQPPQLSSCDGELAVAPLPEGDLPGQFTRVMGKGTVLSREP